MQKYSKGEVKILVDGFDEISPTCKENTTKLFQNFDINKKNQLIITTRTHLEHDLEKKLSVLAHKIKILTEDEQVKFLQENWVNLDQNLVTKCANLLVDKISEISSSKPSLIGVPLILQGLAEAYKDKINENFEHEIENLNISSIYKKIIETFFNIFSSRFPQNQKKVMSPLQIHQFLSIRLFFNEGLAHLLGLKHDEDEWSFEEIARCGLVKYEKDGNFHFNHQTYAESFISDYVFDLINTFKTLPEVQLYFISQILIDEKFQVTRMFLESTLNDVEKVQNLKSFNSSHEICQKVKDEKKFLHFCVVEGLFNIFEFFTLAVKKGDIKLFKEMIEERVEDEATNLMIILPHAVNPIKFENLINEILNFYSENPFGDFLLKTDKLGDAILHYFAMFCKKREVLECFWNKIKIMFRNEERGRLRNFLLRKGGFGANALLQSTTNEISFFFLFEEVFYKNFYNLKNFVYETDKSGDNLLHYLARHGSVSMLKFALKLLKSEFPTEELQNFVKLKNKNGENLLHCAAFSNENEKSVEFLVNLIKTEIGSEGIKNMLSERDKSNCLSLHYVLIFDNLKPLRVFLSLYQENFNSEELKTLLTATNKEDEKIFTMKCKLDEECSDLDHLKWQKMLDAHCEAQERVKRKFIRNEELFSEFIHCLSMQKVKEKIGLNSLNLDDID